MVEATTRLKRLSWQMGQELGREPTPEELSERLRMPLDKVRQTMKVAREPISLETPIGEEEDGHLGDLIEDEDAVQPLDAAIQSDLRDAVSRVLGSLTPREERILRMRFGIGTNPDHTLQEVGKVFSVTRERIRQIEAKALQKLKHPSRARALRTLPATIEAPRSATDARGPIGKAIARLVTLAVTGQGSTEKTLLCGRLPTGRRPRLRFVVFMRLLPARPRAWTRDALRASPGVPS